MEKKSWMFFPRIVAGEDAKQLYLYQLSEGKWDLTNQDNVVLLKQAYGLCYEVFRRYCNDQYFFPVLHNIC